MADVIWLLFSRWRGPEFSGVITNYGPDWPRPQNPLDKEWTQTILYHWDLSSPQNAYCGEKRGSATLTRTKHTPPPRTQTHRGIMSKCAAQDVFAIVFWLCRTTPGSIISSYVCDNCCDTIIWQQIPKYVDKLVRHVIHECIMVDVFLITPANLLPQHSWLKLITKWWCYMENKSDVFTAVITEFFCISDTAPLLIDQKKIIQK